MKKISYFFLDGRKERINSGENFPEEMFYGYNYISQNFPNVHIIEAKKNFLRSNIQKYFEDKLSYLLELPIFFSYFLSFKNIYHFLTSSHVVLTNHRVATSTLPLIFVSKIFLRKPKISIFVMGIFKKTPKTIFRNKIKLFLINYLFKNSDEIYFLGKEELDYAKSSFNKYENKLFYYPFSVDLKFWKSKTNKKKSQILFVGSDGNRDFEFLYKLVSEMQGTEFVILSDQVDFTKLNFPNCKIIKGSFANQGISDIDLRLLYSESWFTILPLKDSIQPSGQSVTLQSIACGTPVLITRTQGFWDNDNFKDKEHIYFLENNNIKLWKETIESLPNFKDHAYKKVQNSSKLLIKKNYDLDIFHRNFHSNLENDKI